jgi:hypothetical protein
LCFYRELLSGVKAWGLQVSAGKNASGHTRVCIATYPMGYLWARHRL